MKALLSAAVAACVICFASIPAHAKAVCDIHHLGYTKAQCDECLNMTWSVSRVFPAGVCAAPTPTQAPPKPGPTPGPVTLKMICDIHHLGYTEPECNKCSNMRWSVTKVTPRGACVGTTPPQPIKTGGTGGGGTPAGPSCTLTPWSGATLRLAAPNFSGTGVPVSVCHNGYDLARSRLSCTNGTPARAFNAPNTNVTCNHTVGPAGIANPQVMINGEPCCY